MSIRDRIRTRTARVLREDDTPTPNNFIKHEETLENEQVYFTHHVEPVED